MITELQFNIALQTVKRYKDQTNDSHYEAVLNIKKDTTCANWAKKHPNMSYRLKSVLKYNCPKVKVLKVTNEVRKMTRGFGPKCWMEFCHLTGRSHFS